MTLRSVFLWRSQSCSDSESLAISTDHTMPPLTLEQPSTSRSRVACWEYLTESISIRVLCIYLGISQLASPNLSRFMVRLERIHLGPTLHWDAARELGWMGSTRSCERVRRTSAIIASLSCLTRRETTLFAPPSLCQPVELWAPRW